MTAQTLAEAPALRVLPVPIAEPRPALRVIARNPSAERPGADQGVLVLRTSDGDGSPEQESPPQRSLPPALHWTRQFVQAALEVAAGRRAPSQLVRWTSEDVFTTLARRAALAARVDRAERATGATARNVAVAVRSVRMCHPGDGIVEASAVVTDRGRVRAVALRVEGIEGRWRVTALEIG
ncbi:MAG TPA: Rv3235 family protein [Kineosporiaceae bacterium]|nr:Rv3235 family protein [Kineosporiaceae bacterium]